MALGAQHRDVLRLVMKDGVKLGLLGIALGLAGAIALTRLVSLLFEVTPTDPATLIGVALLLAAVLAGAYPRTAGLEHPSSDRVAPRSPASYWTASGDLRQQSRAETRR